MRQKEQDLKIGLGRLHLTRVEFERLIDIGAEVFSIESAPGDINIYLYFSKLSEEQIKYILDCHLNKVYHVYNEKGELTETRPFSNKDISELESELRKVATMGDFIKSTLTPVFEYIVTGSEVPLNGLKDQGINLITVGILGSNREAIKQRMLDREISANEVDQEKI